LCQLNREIEKRTKFVPKPGDLKESGQFEQDADVILFLVWPHKIDQNEDPQEYLVFVDKNRNRAINQRCVKLKFRPSRQMLEEWKPKFQSGWPTSTELGFE
jgi:replicative DNA helicase